MEELEKLILDDCSLFGHELEPISPKVLHLSLINTHLNVDQLANLLQKTSILIHLNVIGTRIGKKELLNFISTKKKYINNLTISEEQYSNKLLENNSGSSPIKKAKSSKNLSPEKRLEQQIFDYI